MNLFVNIVFGFEGNCMDVLGVLKKGFRFIFDKDYRFLAKAKMGIYDSMYDEEYLKRFFKACLGRDLNLVSPKSYNEKLQWLKLHDRSPKYVIMVDKYKVRDYITKMLGEEYLIPLLGVWEDPSDINFDALPNQFVLKCNHNSGLGMCICKDKSTLNIKHTRKKLKKGIEQDYYLFEREWPYKDVPRKIIAERYMGQIDDYKFFCFNGVIDSVMVCKERDKGYPKFIFYDKDWNRLYYQYYEPSKEYEEKKPEKYDEMKKIAEKLSKGYPHIRVDLYLIDNHVYFGELTLYNQSGFDTDITYETDLMWGEKLILPNGTT
jgi:hypothetical protein